MKTGPVARPYQLPPATFSGFPVVVGLFMFPPFPLFPPLSPSSFLTLQMSRNHDAIEFRPVPSQTLSQTPADVVEKALT